MDGKSEITITYETLFELMQREKNRGELQDLGNNFYSDLVDYLRSKNQLLKAKKAELSSFSSNEAKKIEMQLENIYRIIKDLYEKRERKIVLMALEKARTKSSIIDSSKLLREEKEFFNEMLMVFSRYRTGVLDSLIAGCMPFRQERSPADRSMVSSGDRMQAGTDALKNDSPVQIPGSAGVSLESTVSTAGNVLAGDTKASSDKASPEADLHNVQTGQRDIVVRFVGSVPKFVGKELEIYGPFEDEEIAALPREIADILIRKGKAEEISSS